MPREKRAWDEKVTDGTGGAAAGGGQGIALALTRGGASVTVASVAVAQRLGEEAEWEAAYLRTQYRVDAICFATNVTVAAEVERMVGTAKQRLGRLDNGAA